MTQGPRSSLTTREVEVFIGVNAGHFNYAPSSCRMMLVDLCAIRFVVAPSLVQVGRCQAVDVVA